MHFSTRQRLCRAVFCLVCVVPTMMVVGAAAVSQSPAYRAAQRKAYESRLSARFGVPVELAGVDRLGHGSLVAREIELKDPESRHWLVRARSAEAVETPQGWTVKLNQPEIRLAQLPRLAELVHEHVLRRADERTTALHVVSSSLILQDELNPRSLLDLRCDVEGGAEGAEMFLEFRAPTLPPEQRIRLRLVRNRQLSPPATGWELHTGAAGADCALLVPWFPAIARLGETATFQGSIWCEQARPGWNVDLAGVFDRVDLDRLITRQFPHKLTGLARVEFTEFQLAQGTLSRAAGRLHCDAGVISQSLLDAAGVLLNLERQERMGDVAHSTYQHLSMDFSLDAHRLVIAPREGETAIIGDQFGPLLSAEAPSQLSPLALVQLLVPQADLLVPATRETARLFHALPLPAATRASVRAGELPYSPLRFGVY